MKKKTFVLEWQREVRMDCSVHIQAKTQEEALKIWKECAWDPDNYDESESSELDVDEPTIYEEE